MTENTKIILDSTSHNSINLAGNEGISYSGYDGSLVIKASRNAEEILIRLLPGAGLLLGENGATVDIDAETALDLKNSGAAYYCLEVESQNKSHVVKIEAPMEVV